MPPRRAEEIPLKRASTIGVKLSSGLPPGEILTDITQNSWRLGNPIGCGGFGDVYLASNEINKPVASNAKYVIKIEPHSNGPLFVEMNFYIRAARKPTIESWCKSQNISHIGIPSYEGSGSHIFEGQRYRFLVIPRYGIDVGNLFISNGRQLPAKLVNSLAIQMLYSLEYIHSKGYAHSDVKGSNILLKRNNSQEYPTSLEKTHAYLVDYGLAYRYRTGNGVHKPFIHDERRAHEGTLEFTSRDAHHGTHSRRGDLETLGYNILQWLCGRLPWEKEGGGMPLTVDPDDIHEKKEKLMVNVDLLMKECFGDKKKAPENITEYMKYIVNLQFQSRPDYEYLRSLFSHDLNLDSIFGKRISNSNENFFSIKPHRRPFLRERKPCKPVNGDVRITRNTHPSVEKVSKKADDFSWEAVLACHPDKIAKISAQIPLSPLTPPPSPPPIQSIPTYAMLQVMQRIKEKQNGFMRHRVNSKSSDNDLKPKWMTPAMEEVAQLKLKNASVEAKSKNNKRFTRSEAQRKRNNLKRKSEVDSKVLSKKRKLLTSN